MPAHRTWTALAAGLGLTISACNQGIPVTKTARVVESEQGAKQGTIFPPGAAPALAPGTGAGTPVRSGDPVVVHNCRLTVFNKQEVPAERDGKLAWIGTAVKDGEYVPEDRLFFVPTNGKGLPQEANAVPAYLTMASGLVTAEVWPPSSSLPLRLTSHLSSAMVAGNMPGPAMEKFRRLKEGDRIEAGQIVGRLDTSLAREDVNIKQAKVLQAVADHKTSEKLKEEAIVRRETGYRLRGQNVAAMSKEDVSERVVAVEKYTQEAIAKNEAIRVAQAEMNQAKTIVDKHDVRAQIGGIVKTIYKNPGEAVKQYEPVMLIHNTDRLRVEGLIETQYLPRVHKGMKVVVEATQTEGPNRTLVGHLGEVTGVAVAPAAMGEPVVASASEDGTIRLWSAAGGRERSVTHNLSDGRPIAVRCLAASPAAAQPLLLSGGADGIARLWEVEGEAKGLKAAGDLAGQHHGPVNCVAFSPDGKFCATGGDDHAICLWDVADHKFLYRLPQLHKGGVTSVQFTPGAQLVSAARDGSLRVWSLDEKEGKQYKVVDRRGGEVGQLGVSPDGTKVLFDQGKTIRIMRMPDLLTEGALQNPTGVASFSSFAMFSPDGLLVLTAGATEGRLQLWRTPTDQTRGYELRQMVANDRGATTAASFDPRNRFIVTGTRTGLVHIWPTLTTDEVAHLPTAEIVNVEQSIEGAGRQVRIWAEMANPANRLIPGNTVTVAIYPEK